MITEFSRTAPGPGPQAATTGAEIRTAPRSPRVVEQAACAVFRAQFEDIYRQYAAVRLGDQIAGEAIAAAAWEAIERAWGGLLRDPSPAPGAWALLTRAVRACPTRPASAMDRLPCGAADTFLLRHCVGLDAERAAQTMGIESAAFESLYRTVVPHPGNGNPTGISIR